MGARALTLTRIDMDEALVSQQIHLLYQPIFALQDGALARVEALVRWDHPRFGTMLPAVFLPAFEAEDRLGALTRRILERATSEFSSWAFSRPAALSINLSPRDCTDPALADTVRGVLEDTRLPADKLTLECPVKLEEVDTAIPVLRMLKDTGVRLAAELMGRAEAVAEAMSIAPFDEIKTGGRGLLRAARNNHTASLIGARELIAYAEANGAIVTAIGAEDEAACHALRTVGFHQVQANVLSAALPLDAITPSVTNAARVILGMEDRPARDPAFIAQDADGLPDNAFRLNRLRAQAEMFKRAAQRGADGGLDDDGDALPQRGAKAMQRALAETLNGERHEEKPMDADSKAGLLMRPDLAAASLGYGSSPLRAAPKKERSGKAAIIVVEPSESEAVALSREPEVARAITDVLDDLPPALAERQGLDDADDDRKADELDAEVAKLPPLTAEAFLDDTPPPHIGDELFDLAARLRPAPERKGNFLTRKYRIRVTHFWPKPWKRAFLRMIDNYRSAGLSEQQFQDRLGGQRGEEDAVAMMSLRPNEPGPLFAQDDRTLPADERAATGQDSQPLGTVEAR